MHVLWPGNHPRLRLTSTRFSVLNRGMAEIVHFDLAFLIRAGKRIRTDLERMRQTKLRYGKTRLSESKHAELVQELVSLRDHLQKLIATNAAAALENRELARIVEQAKVVLEDCNEMLTLVL